MLALTSCKAYRYFPVRQQIYGFDSCGDVRLSGNVGLKDISASIAYSPLNHVALTAHINGGYNRGKYERNMQYGVGSGFGFYSKLTERSNLDLFFEGDLQRVRSHMFPVRGSGLSHDLYPNSGNYYHLLDTVVFKTYYSITAQPTYYFAMPSLQVKFFVTCGATAVLTKPPHYFPFAPKFGQYEADVLIEPGIGITSIPMAAVGGIAPVFSIYHDVTNNYAPNAYGNYDKVTKAFLYQYFRLYANVVLTDKIFKRKKNNGR